MLCNFYPCWRTAMVLTMVNLRFSFNQIPPADDILTMAHGKHRECCGCDAPVSYTYVLLSNLRIYACRFERSAFVGGRTGSSGSNPTAQRDSLTRVDDFANFIAAPACKCARSRCGDSIASCVLDCANNNGEAWHGQGTQSPRSIHIASDRKGITPSRPLLEECARGRGHFSKASFRCNMTRDHFTGAVKAKTLGLFNTSPTRQHAVVMRRERR